MHHLLLADIGGTHARLAPLLNGAPGPVTTLRLADFASPEVLLATQPYRHAVLAVAGPVAENSAMLTNRGWYFSGAALRAHIVNDFEALAWALPSLTAAELLPLGGGAAPPGAPMAVLGPGTGLGVAAMLPPATVLPGEGGHATLAAGNDAEAEVLALLRGRYGGHCSAERVLSGPGLVALHAALAELSGRAPEQLPPGEILAHHPETLAMFCAMLGGFAGNVALTYGARGGVFLAGGILPRMPGLLAASEFRARFAAKGRMAPYLAGIPTWLILHPNPALPGLAALAKRLAF